MFSKIYKENKDIKKKIKYVSGKILIEN